MIYMYAVELEPGLYMGGMPYKYFSGSGSRYTKPIQWDNANPDKIKFYTNLAQARSQTTKLKNLGYDARVVEFELIRR